MQNIQCPDAVLHTVHQYKSALIPYSTRKDYKGCQNRFIRANWWFCQTPRVTSRGTVGAFQISAPTRCYSAIGKCGGFETFFADSEETWGNFGELGTICKSTQKASSI